MQPATAARRVPRPHRRRLDELAAPGSETPGERAQASHLEHAGSRRHPVAALREHPAVPVRPPQSTGPPSGRGPTPRRPSPDPPAPRDPYAASPGPSQPLRRPDPLWSEPGPQGPVARVRSPAGAPGAPPGALPLRRAAGIRPAAGVWTAARLRPAAGQPQPYGYGPPYARPRQTNTSAIVLLIVSGLSTLFGCLFAIPAVILGDHGAWSSRTTRPRSRPSSRAGAGSPTRSRSAVVIVGGIIGDRDLRQHLHSTTGF